jgi:hypothetical protein
MKQEYQAAFQEWWSTANTRLTKSAKICENKSVGKACTTPIICWDLKKTEAAKGGV